MHETPTKVGEEVKAPLGFIHKEKLVFIFCHDTKKMTRMATLQFSGQFKLNFCLLFCPPHNGFLKSESCQAAKLPSLQ